MILKHKVFVLIETNWYEVKEDKEAIMSYQS